MINYIGKRKGHLILSLIGLAVLALSGCSSSEPENEAKASPVELTHVHGLGYSRDGKQLIIPAHDGVKLFADGNWSNAGGEPNDYMGMTIVDNGFYSSGHPGPGSNLKNPLGIVKSTDYGKSLDILDLHGEVDFHAMAAGYESHALYVFNEQPNSKMKESGLYYTLDETKTWKKSQMKGLEGEPIALAIHPADDSILAVGTDKGLFVSSDHGDNFEKRMTDQVTALFYNHQGDLFVGGYNGNAYLQRWDHQTQEPAEIKIPPLTKDAVAYFAENPANEKEFVFASFNKDVYLSSDRGETWSQIAKAGAGMSHDHQEDGHGH